MQSDNRFIDLLEESFFIKNNPVIEKKCFRSLCIYKLSNIRPEYNIRSMLYRNTNSGIAGLNINPVIAIYIHDILACCK